ncbi:MAG: hypothetical protein M3P43_02375 [Actinomycetota bacterium]|nr:hypothetical protein [Actinomycetota bacterium]
MRSRRFVMAALATLLVVGAVSALTVLRRPAVAGTGGIDSADFTNPVANPYFPLKVGTVSRYQGSDGAERFREQVTVTHWTKKIQGVTTTVILDVLHRADDGSLAEKTWDWYADDNAGNVWYFGERTATYTRAGRVNSREGSWQAGVHGAVAGTIMPANPHPTDAYRQEFLAGHAEDQAWIVQRSAHVTVPHRHLDHVVRSFEWTRLEADVLSLKFYARGLGIVLERDVAGGSEIFRLVSVTHA